MISANAIIREFTWKSEMELLEAGEIKMNRASLRKRISEICDVFTQDLEEERKRNVLERILNSIYVISQDHWKNQENSLFLTGYINQPAIYLPTSRIIKIAEHYFNKKGYLERELLFMLGNVNVKITADAVAAFYLEDEFVGYGLPTQRDYRVLWVAKNLIPADFQWGKIREASYRLGNLARENERKKEGTGLQYIYEQTRR